MMLLPSPLTAQLTNDELCALLIVVHGDLANYARESATFALLRAIIVRRLVAPEVYDIIDDVSKMFVRSHKASSRRQCSNVLLQFLLRYPLGAERLQQHLDHFVKNLGYAYPDGRLAVLDMLHAIVMKFPRDELNKQVCVCALLCGMVPLPLPCLPDVPVPATLVTCV
jgi:U3 small nucleolar RNA-associated protein 20